MFGLSVWEILIIVGLIVAIAGPAGLVMVLKSVKEVNRAKREIVEAVNLEKIVTDKLGSVSDTLLQEGPKKKG